MRTSTAVASLAIVAAVTPALTLPVSEPIITREPKEGARALSLGVLGKDLGKGLLTGGGFAGLGALLGGDSSDTAGSPADTKRAFTIDDIEAEMAKRGVYLGSLGKDLGKGLLTGGAFAGLGALLDGDSSDTVSPPAAAKRALPANDIVAELARRGGLGSVFGKLVGATEDDIGTVIKNGLAGGLATGAAVSAGDAVLGNNKREMDNIVEQFKRDLLGRSLLSSAGKVLEGGTGDAIKSGLVNGLGSAIGGSAIGALLDANRRDLEERSLLSSAGKFLEGGTGDAIKSGLVNGLGSAIGGTAIGAALNSVKREPLGSIGKGLLGTGVGIVASSGIEEAIDGVESLFDRSVSLDELD